MKSKIIAWLDLHNVTDYTLIEDSEHGYVVDVDTEVVLSNITEIAVQFNRVSHTFDCARSNLTSLKGAPRIVGGDFLCFKNNLTSLEGTPHTVDGSFLCSYNQLENLKYSPESISENFFCDNNKLTTLEGAPQSVGGYFCCNDNLLRSLDYLPEVESGVNLSGNAELGSCQEIKDYEELLPTWELLREKKALEAQTQNSITTGIYKI